MTFKKGERVLVYTIGFGVLITVPEGSSTTYVVLLDSGQGYMVDRSQLRLETETAVTANNGRS